MISINELLRRKYPLRGTKFIVNEYEYYTGELVGNLIPIHYQVTRSVIARWSLENWYDSVNRGVVKFL